MDYTQMNQYSKLETYEPPESIIQLSAAVYYNYISHDDGKKEISRRDYFHVPDCIVYVQDYLSLSNDDIKNIYS